MRYHELTEAIINRPYHLGSFVKSKIKQLNKLVADKQQAIILIKQHERDGGDMLNYWLRAYPDQDHIYINNLGYVISSDRYVPVENLRDNLESFLNHGKNFLSYVMKTFDYANPITDETKKELDALHYAEQGAKDYGYDENDPSGLDDEYYSAMDLLKGYRLGSNVIIQTLKIWSEVKSKLGEVKKMQDMGYDHEKFIPDHEPIEKLFHTTAFVNEILKDGFQAEKPIDRKGLGNFGEQATISVSHSLDICRTIMRSLKEVWMITHGQLTASQIVGWFDAENIPLEYAYSNIGRSIQLRALTDPKKIAGLYNVWLWHTKTRTNPAFAGMNDLVDIMKTRSLQDIGVLECEVDLSDKPEYIFAESEFRVTPDKIISVKRIL